MHNALAHIAAGDFDPILMAPNQGARVTACLRALAAHERAADLLGPAVDAAMNAHDDYWPAQGDWQCAYKPYVVKGGILHIPVKGMLLHNYPYQIGSYATGYYYIQKAMERGLADPEVKGIALVCDSPGGHVAGCFELVDRIYAARKIKPVQAFAHEMAFSAAYAVASAASKITVSRTGGVGSIGVVTMHVNFAKALEMEGVEVTFIFAGKHKVDGNPYEALSADAKARIQGRIDETYGVFVESVARNRNLAPAKIRKTEALTFTATEAVDQSLADKVGPFDEAIADFSACLYGEGENQMSTETPKPIAQADHDKAVSDAAATARAEAKQRIVAIKALDEAKTRPAAAEACAMDTDMTVDQAKAFLAKLPAEGATTAAAPTNGANAAFEQAMGGVKPGPGAAATEAQDLTPEQKDAAVAARVLAARYGDAKPATKH